MGSEMCIRDSFGIEREEKLPDGTTRKVSLLADKSYSKDSAVSYTHLTLPTICSV